MHDRHRIQYGVWNSEVRGYLDGQRYTIRGAIDYWYNSEGRKEGVAFRDVCSGPHCSRACPEMIVLAQGVESEAWSLAVRATIAAVVLLIAVTSLVLKVLLSLCSRTFFSVNESCGVVESLVSAYGVFLTISHH